MKSKLPETHFRASSFFYCFVVLTTSTSLSIGMPGGSKSKGGSKPNYGAPKGPPSKKSLARFKRDKKAAGMMLYNENDDAMETAVMSKIDAKPKDVSYLERESKKPQQKVRVEYEEEEPVVNPYDALLQSFQLNNIEDARKAVKKRKREDQAKVESAKEQKEVAPKKKSVASLKALLEDKPTKSGTSNGHMHVDDSDGDKDDGEDSGADSESIASEDDNDKADRKRHNERLQRIKKVMEGGDAGEEEVNGDEEESEGDNGEFEAYQPSDEEDIYDEHFGMEIPEELAEELLEDTKQKWVEVEDQSLFNDAASVWIDSRTPDELPEISSTSEFKVHPKVVYAWNLMFDDLIKDKEASQKAKSGELKMTTAQRSLFSLLNDYSDVLYCLRTPLNALEIMSTYALHIANHMVKSAERIRASNAKIHQLAAKRRKIKSEITMLKQSLEKKKVPMSLRPKEKEEEKESVVPVLSNHVPGEDNENNEESAVDITKMPRAARVERMKELHGLLKEETEFRDQGFTKPKVLVLLPMKNSALEFVEILIKTLPRAMVSVVENRRKFYGDFFEEVYTSRASRPLEWLATFRGNTDDTFRLGISFRHNKTVKLYSGFYNSDIIVASPLGLRLAVDEKEQGAFDFLSSLELVVADQTDVMLMQNWEHVEYVFNHMSQLPAKTRPEIDFSRVRQYYLNRQAKLFRQTILLSSTINVDINALFNRQCLNAFGRYKVRPTNEEGTISKILAGSASLRQVFFRLSPASVVEADDVRFDYFTKQVWEHLSGTSMEGTLIVVPSYFDFPRLREFFREISNNSDINIVAVSEYTNETRGIKYRKHFYTGRAQIMLITERYHWYKRIRIRGIKSVIWYSPPLFSQLYSEIANWVEEGGSSLTLYSKYDIMNLEGVVGRQRASAMVESERTTHSISS